MKHKLPYLAIGLLALLVSAGEVLAERFGEDISLRTKDDEFDGRTAELKVGKHLMIVYRERETGWLLEHSQLWYLHNAMSDDTQRGHVYVFDLRWDSEDRHPDSIVFKIMGAGAKHKSDYSVRPGRMYPDMLKRMKTDTTLRYRVQRRESWSGDVYDTIGTYTVSLMGFTKAHEAAKSWVLGGW